VVCAGGCQPLSNTAAGAKPRAWIGTRLVGERHLLELSRSWRSE
jgi:hypothetical protein